MRIEADGPMQTAPDILTNAVAAPSESAMLLPDDEVREVGRRLGYDLAHYGMELWDSAACLPGVAEGYSEGGRSPGAKDRTVGRFIRKWLQVRVQALRRRRVVDESVTPRLIAEIDHKQCPVSLIDLTHGTRTDTDWSVDRINNQGGYADNNLVVLSTRVNKAKGAKTFEEVCSLSKRDTPCEGLTPQEWLRLATIMFAPCAAEKPQMLSLLPWPLATRIPNRSVRPLWFQLQHCILKAAERFSSHNKLRRGINPILSADQAASLEATVCVLRPRLEVVSYPYDALIDEQWQQRLYNWLQGLGQARYHLLRHQLLALAGGEPPEQFTVKGWSLQTRGYM